MILSVDLSRSEYVVLALIARYGPMTPYELKSRVADSVGFFWPIPHAQLYRDAPRLAELGLLAESAGAGGRRRRVFSLTLSGREALLGWFGGDHASEVQIRDPALLKLAFASLGSPQDVAALARAQAELHRHRDAEYARRADGLDPDEAAAQDQRRVLELGRAIEGAYARFWAGLAADAGVYSRPAEPSSST